MYMIKGVIFKVTLIAFIVVISSMYVFSLPPTGIESPGMSTGVKSEDQLTYFDANRLLMFVTNVGSIGHDYTKYFGTPFGWGCFYSYTGNCYDIDTATIYKLVLYDAGICLIGKVGGDVRTVIGPYGTEFYPGPADENGNAQTDQLRYKVYKIQSDSSIWLKENKAGCEIMDSTNHFDDWQSWKNDAVQDGAPVDGSGNPLLIGDQTLWTVYNDGGTHSYTQFGGGTEPLGVEVHQTVWGSGEDEDVVYVKYKLYNKGSNVIDSFYISFLVDNDLSAANDDLSGCDTVRDLFFGYNEDNYDYYWGSEIVSFGGKVVAGPVVPSAGDTAEFDGQPMPEYKNIGISSFNDYHWSLGGCTAEELFLYVQGCDAGTGQPYVDPITSDTIKYFAPGSPLTDEGWLDSEAADTRMMVNFGPLTFNPGDSQQVVLKLAAHAAPGRLNSLYKLLAILDSSYLQEPFYTVSDSVQVWVTNYGQLSWVGFTPPDQQWLTGVDFGAPDEYFDRGAQYGCFFFGSYLNPTDHPDSFHTVDVRFSNTETQKAYRYVRTDSSVYNYGGYYDVPFTVWERDTERQLNAAFVEWTESSVYDSTWGPSGDYDEDGGREYIIIFNTDYSGDDPYNASISYPDLNIYDDADQIDALYAAWPVVMSGHSLAELNDGQSLTFFVQNTSIHYGQIDTIAFPETQVGDTAGQDVNIKCFTEGRPVLKLNLSNPSSFAFSDSAHNPVNEGIWTVTVNFTPPHVGDFEAYLYVNDSVAGETKKEIKLLGKAITSVDVSDEKDNIIPERASLSQNYPNPFNPSTTIEYTLQTRSDVTITVYEVLGRKVKTIFNQTMPVGTHTAIWDGTDIDNNPVATGVYLYQIKAGDFVESKKMLLLK